METDKITVTSKNRDMAGFVGVDDEYLVIPPEILAEGEFRRVETIGDESFRASKLSVVVLPDSVHEIRTYAFYGCRSLREVVLSNTLRTIGTFAFKGCHQLKCISIPS